jgi:hypothetical protein
MISLKKYAVHGHDVDSLLTGLVAIGMPSSRTQEAMQAVKAIVAAEGITGLSWYKVPNTAELALRWDGCVKNMAWIQVSNIHVDPAVAFPLRVTGHTHDGLPQHHWAGVNPRGGGSRGGGSVRQTPFCPNCHNPHGVDEECF